MTNSDELDENVRRTDDQRRVAIKRWAEYVRSHDDAEWSREQNKLINSQLESANDLAASGATDPVRFFERVDRQARR